MKEFVVDDMLGQNEQTNEVKKYSDMRYEINKLSVLNHDYIVKFVGVVARPPSFVLEWAPLMSLEKIRVLHEKQRCPICPVSLYITLLQVTVYILDTPLLITQRVKFIQIHLHVHILDLHVHILDKQVSWVMDGGYINCVLGK